MPEFSDQWHTLDPTPSLKTLDTVEDHMVLLELVYPSLSTVTTKVDQAMEVWLTIEINYSEVQTTRADKMQSREMIESTMETKARTSLGVRLKIEADQTASLVTLPHHTIKMKTTTTHFCQE